MYSYIKTFHRSLTSGSHIRTMHQWMNEHSEYEFKITDHRYLNSNLTVRLSTEYELTKQELNELGLE